MEAQQYVNEAIRKIRTSDRQLKKWFGADDQYYQKSALKILNSVNNMLGNIEYVYPGPECSADTFAYVYPHGIKSHDSGGHYMFYLCDLYMRSSRTEQIQTLTHEGSHHATVFEQDVKFDGGKAYGRQVCEQLACSDPELALLNADNFCYFVQDVTDDEDGEDHECNRRYRRT